MYFKILIVATTFGINFAWLSVQFFELVCYMNYFLLITLIKIKELNIFIWTWSRFTWLYTRFLVLSVCFHIYTVVFQLLDLKSWLFALTSEMNWSQLNLNFSQLFIKPSLLEPKFCREARKKKKIDETVLKNTSIFSILSKYNHSKIHVYIYNDSKNI